jgi:hypothetical protein
MTRPYSMDLRRLAPKASSANPETKPQSLRPNPSPLIDRASISVVQAAKRAREQVWASAKTQLKIAAIVACRGVEGKARRAQARWRAPSFDGH